MSLRVPDKIFFKGGSALLIDSMGGNPPLTITLPAGAYDVEEFQPMDRAAYVQEACYVLAVSGATVEVLADDCRAA